MKKIIFLLFLLIFIFSGQSIAAPLLFDDFNSERGGSGVVNYSNFTNWTVTDGTVDLIGNGYEDFLPGNGLYVDLDGSTNNAGIMTSKTAFNFEAGKLYELSFSLAGNNTTPGANSDTVSLKVSLGTLLDQNINVQRNDPFMAFTYTFMGDGKLGQLTFANAGGDNVGALLDNVKLDVAPVPEPISMLLFGTGIVGVDGYIRKKFKQN